LKGAETLYREALRPQFHFSPRRGWNNDPNGLVHYKGEYHLFFQHNPYGWNWGNMHWGHAVSPDLIHWRELDDAVYPDALGTAFSGSAVVDEGNTAGFARGAERAIVCIYTAAGGTSRQSQGAPFSQCLCYSIDRGRTWTKYAKNPVVPHIAASNRDPKVTWFEPEKKWVMALFLDGNDYALFDSPDLKSWKRLCGVKVPGAGECPEFFEIAVDPSTPDGAVARGAQQGDTRWVFYGGNGLYLVGRFDGKTYTPESGPHPLNLGNCFYASQTFNGVPDGRRVLVPWGQVAMPGMPFNQMMGIPVALTLRTTEDGLRLSAYPVREVESLRAKKHGWKDASLKPGENLLAGLNGDLFDIAAELAPGGAEEVGFNIRGFAVVYDAKKQELRCGDKRAALAMVDGKVRLRLLVDRRSVDVFGNDGRAYMPMQFHPPADNRALELFSRGGEAKAVSLDVYALQSAWGR
jgi:sucrose-6-phosphate hydrolase SacC (GH32 family)